MTATRQAGSPLRLGVLVSGSGSNLQAILDAVGDGSLDAEVRVVISNRAGALALERAARAGVPTRTVLHREFASREAFDAALVTALREADVELVVLAGFMRLLTPVMLDAFAGRVVNIHPALLPAFPGVDAQAQAVAYGVRITGCTVHFVDAGTDTGPIVAQSALAVHPDDTADSLRARLLPREHALLVEVLRWIAAGRVEWVAPESRASSKTGRASARPSADAAESAPGIATERARVIVHGASTVFGLADGESPATGDGVTVGSTPGATARSAAGRDPT